MKRESLNTSILLPHFHSEIESKWWNLCSQWYDGFSGYPRFPIAEMHLRNFLTIWNFEAGKSTSRLRFVQEQQIFRSLCTGSKKSIDELMTSPLIVGRTDFLISIYMMRWLRLHWKGFSTRIYTSEKEYMSKSSMLRSLADSYEEDKLRTWSMSISVQAELKKQYKGLSDLFTISLQNDDVQDFDVRCDHAPLRVSEMPSDVILEGLYKSKIQDSAEDSKL